MATRACARNGCCARSSRAADCPSPASSIPRRARRSASRANRFLNYTVTADDVGSIMPKPESWIAKSKAARLGYNDIWEMLAEKFHCTRGYLKALNPGVAKPVAGTEIIGPKVYPAAPVPKAASPADFAGGDEHRGASTRMGRSSRSSPARIAKDKNKRPHGLLTVKVVDPRPDYTFDPALFADAAKGGGHQAQDDDPARAAQSRRHDVGGAEPARLRHPRHAGSRSDLAARNRTAASGSRTGTRRRCSKWSASARRWK